MSGQREPAQPTDLPVESDSNRLGDIQGLRALAVLLVVLYHAGLPLPGGFVGVDVFFVISGFVITALLLREIRTHGRIRFVRFYTRRIRRLLPALAVVLVFTSLISTALQSPLGAQQDTALAGIGASAWLANGALYIITGDYFDNSADTIPLLHTWSLAVEEQFYLVFPVLLLGGYVLARRRGRSGTRGGATSVALVSVLSFCLALWLSYGNPMPGVDKPQTAAFYLAPTRAWEFGAGAIVAIVVARSPTVGRRQTLAAAWAGGILLGSAAVAIRGTTPFPGLAALVPVLGTSLLIFAGRGVGNPVSRVLSAPQLQWIGDLSYSWYLWHWPLIVFSSLLWPASPFSKICAAIVSLGVAWLSYLCVEQPIRRGVSAVPRVTVRLALASILVPMLAFGGLYLGANQSWGNDRIASAARQVNPVPMGYRAGCHNSTPIGDRDLTNCTFLDPKSSRTIYLAGDSNAGQYAEAVVGAGQKLDRTVVLATMSGCPFLDIEVVQPGVDTRPCTQFVESSSKWFKRQSPSTIVLAAANEAIDDPDIGLRAPGRTRIARTPANKEAAWGRALARTARTLRSAGHEVIIVNVMPHLRDRGGRWWSPGQCTLPSMLRSMANCSASMSLQAADRAQQRPLRAENRAAARSGARQVNLRKSICTGGDCRALRGAHWVYRDGLHISTTESRRLVSQFTLALQPRS